MEDYIAFGIGIILAMFCIVILEKIEAERENNEKEKFIKYNNWSNEACYIYVWNMQNWKEETAINVRFFYNYKLILVMTIERGMQKTSFTCDMVHDL